MKQGQIYCQQLNTTNYSHVLYHWLTRVSRFKTCHSELLLLCRAACLQLQQLKCQGSEDILITMCK